MRPLKLSVQGFTCFREYTEVDFEGMQLYAIQGQTGSGKSSLLDAMTFALYGRTPRLGSKGMDALISQGEAGLAVALEFETAGERYRVARTWNRKTSGNDLRFERIEGERHINLAENKKAQIQELVTRTLGLDFEAFTRAVLLPQGQFDSFLKGTDKDRQKLLGDLTNMGHVRRMAEIAGERSRDLKQQLNTAQQLLEQEYAQVSAEQLAHWRDEARALELHGEALTLQREAAQADVTRLTQLVGWAAEQAKLRAEQAGQREQEEEVLRGDKRAATARRVAGVLPLLNQQDASERAAGQAETEHRQATARSAEAAQVLSEADAALQAAEQAASRIPEWEAQAEKLQGAVGLTAVLKRYGGRLDSSHTQPLEWDEDEYLKAREAAQRAEKLKLERLTLTSELSGLQAEQTRLEAEQALQTQQLAELARTEQDGRQTKELLTSAQEALLEARSQAGLSAYRAHLHLGEACPLCQQTVTVLPEATPLALEPLEATVRTHESNRERLLERFNILRADTRSRGKLLEVGQGQEREWQARLQDRERDLRAAEADLDPQAAERAPRLLAGLAGQLRALGDPVARRQSLLSEIQTARRDESAARTTQAQAASRLAGAQAAEQATRAQAGSRAAELAQAQTAAREALDALDLDASSARAAALPEQEVTRLEQAARDFERERGRVSEALRVLDARLEGQQASPEALSSRTRELGALTSELDSARQHSGVLAEQLRAGEAKLVRKQELERQSALLSRELDTWSALAQALRTNEFQQYLLAEVEAQLLTRAGELLFEISDGRYRLVLRDGDYAVQDLWNAGETRAVRTLSGGETFLASLSLAIALSDYLAGSKILGALFLDEGFGTLDPQSLESVALALENLRTQGRMVGVITHVESLSERMPARILVSKSVAGSRAQRLEE